VIITVQQFRPKWSTIYRCSKGGLGLAIFLLFLFCLSLSAQPIIDNSILPSPGDTIILANDNLPEGVVIFPTRGKQEWDFMNLQSAFFKKTVVRKTNKKEQKNWLPGADIFIEDLKGVKNYYHLHKEELLLVGATGVDPYGVGVELQTTYQPNISVLKTPIEYGDIQNTSSQFSGVLAATDIPLSLLYSLPILPDSIRFVSSVETSQEIDAWGHLVLPDNSFEVLRLRRIMAIKTRLEVKVGLFPWRDITDDIFVPFFQKDKVLLSYHFYSNEARMPVVVAAMKDDGITVDNMEYIVSDPSSIIHNPGGDPDIYAYPNPAIDEVRFAFSNLFPDKYKLKIIDILGRPIMEGDYQLSGFHTIKWDVSKLRKGTYLYTLSNKDGTVIGTRRLMVIRP